MSLFSGKMTIKERTTTKTKLKKNNVSTCQKSTICSEQKREVGFFLTNQKSAKKTGENQLWLSVKETE